MKLKTTTVSFLLTLALLLSGIAHAQPAQQLTPEQDKQILKQRVMALAQTRDLDILETYIADEFIGTNFLGGKFDKEDLIEARINNPRPWIKRSFTDFAITFPKKDIAMVNYKSTFFSGERAMFTKNSHVYVRRDGEWILLSSKIDEEGSAPAT